MATFFKRILRWIALVGPGLFCLGFTIGTGSVTATGENQFIDIKADFVLPVANGTTIAAGSTILYLIAANRKKED